MDDPDAIASPWDVLRRSRSPLHPRFRRLEGELMLRGARARRDEAKRCFDEAIAFARARSVKSFELRAATSLARLLAEQGHRDDARAALADVYGWFTEGFDTADLKAAKALLEAL